MNDKTAQSVISRLTDLLFSVLGSAMVGVSLSIFMVPNDIAPGGVSGLSTALAYLFPSVSVGTFAFALNIPLLIGGWKLLGRRSLIFTIISAALLSVFIDLTTALGIAYTEDKLIAALFGGAMTGIGIGVLFLRGISTGGTDLAALMLRRALPNIPNGTLLLCIDAAVVAFAVLVFRQIEVAMYSAITIFVASKVIDAIAQGVDYAKVIYIITDQGGDMCRALSDADLGSTVIPAMGGYTGEDRQMIVTVTKRHVLAQTLSLIKRTDPQAFTFVTDSTEVHGEGFKLE